MRTEKHEFKVLKKKPMNKQINKNPKLTNPHNQSYSDLSKNNKIKNIDS